VSTITVADTTAAVRFDRYGLPDYQTFLQCKQVPESQIVYDWEQDSYTVSMPTRYAAQLGLVTAVEQRTRLALPAHLFDYQRWTVQAALDARRYAVWMDTGLGKTAVYLEWARQVAHLANGRVLILCPLQVIRQVIREARRFYGDEMPIEHVSSREALAQWCVRPGSGWAITNYEKLTPGVLNELRHLAGIVADESSILKTGGGVIKWNLIKSAKGVTYKLSCTATPAPNDTMEYASQASFLEKLRTADEILWTYFVRDAQGNWRVKPHARTAFYQFMSTWSIYLRNPKHFGWGDILATLPEPDIREYRLGITDDQQERMNRLLLEKNRGLIADDRLGVHERSKLSQLAKGFIYEQGSKRRAVLVPSEKPAFVADLVRQECADGRQVLVWTVFDEESVILAALLKDAPISVAVLGGSMSETARADVLDAFRTGAVRVLISKAQLVGYGLNFQFCRSMVFSGFDDSFERLYQAIRRCYRFGQTETVRVHIPYIPELEGLMYTNVRRKQALFDEDTALQECNYRDVMKGQLA